MRELTTKEVERLKHTLKRVLDLVDSGTSENPPADWFETAETVRGRLTADLEMLEKEEILDPDFYPVGGTI